MPQEAKESNEFCVHHQENFQELYPDEFFCESCLIEYHEGYEYQEVAHVD